MSVFSGIVRGRALPDYVAAESPERGTPYFNVRFRITSPAEHEGKVVAWQAYVTPNTKDRVMESLAACGCTWPDDDFTNLEGIDTNEVELDVGIERWNDKKTGEPREKSRVNWVNAGGGVPEEQRMDDRKKASFASQMKGALKNFKKKMPATPNGAEPRNAGNPEADDLPDFMR